MDSEIATEFGGKEVDYKFYPINKFPYGQLIYGFIHFEDTDGCSAIKIDSDFVPEDIPYFLIIDDANCDIGLKALNA